MAITVARIAEDVGLDVEEVLSLEGIDDLLESHKTKKADKKAMRHVRSPAAYKAWRTALNLPNNLAHLA